MRAIQQFGPCSEHDSTAGSTIAEYLGQTRLAGASNEKSYLFIDIAAMVGREYRFDLDSASGRS